MTVGCGHGWRRLSAAAARVVEVTVAGCRWRDVGASGGGHGRPSWQWATVAAGSGGGRRPWRSPAAAAVGGLGGGWRRRRR